MSMRRRLALILGGLFAIVVAIFGALTFWLAGTNVRGAIDDQLVEQADSVEVLLLDNRRPQLPDLVERTADRLNETTFRFQLVGPGGTIEGDPDLPFDDTIVENALTTQTDHFRTIDLDGRPYRVLTRRRQHRAAAGDRRRIDRGRPPRAPWRAVSDGTDRDRGRRPDRVVRGTQLHQADRRRDQGRRPAIRAT